MGIGAYQFFIINENNQPSPSDSKLKQTVCCIIEGFFNSNPDILLYLCETGDRKQAARNRLFIKWFRDYTNNHLYYFDTCEIRADGIDNFVAIIVQKSNPDLQNIVSDFNHVVGTLKGKPI